MSKDHFAAQTYLKHFGDPALGGMLHAYRKRDGAKFPCWPKDVCWELDGDLNPMFGTTPEVLGDFRKIFEPHWNPSIEGILAGKVTPTEKFIVSAYMANLMASTPTWRRVGIKMYNHNAARFLSLQKRISEKHGGLPELTDNVVKAIGMLERGEIKLATNPDYVKAIATLQLLQYTWITYNQDWLIISNNTSRPFITSDYPPAIDQPDQPWAIMSRFLPITPRGCLAIKYANRALEPLDTTRAREYTQRQPQGTIETTEFNLAGVKMINRLVAQCAEDLVFSSIESAGIATLVKKYATYQVDVNLQEVPLENGFNMVSTICVRDRMKINRYRLNAESLTTLSE